MKQRVIGILGGMGPEATAELLLRIIKATPAQRDQDHIRIIVDNNPKIPDRTEAILGLGPTPLPEIVRTAKNLQKAGAQFIVMPCNTAHYYFNDLRKSVRIPILNMIELCSVAIRDQFPNVKVAGLIATTGTVKARLYDHSLRSVGIRVINPPANLQKMVMQGISNVKAGRIKEGRKTMLRVAGQLARRGCELIICGCTEVSLGLKNGDLNVPVIDPLQILSEAAVAAALGKSAVST